MAEEKKEGGAVGASGGGDGSSVRVSTAFAGVASTVSQPRVRFTVELNPDETTIVSWKKLVRESANDASKPQIAAEAPAGAHPALQSRLAPPGQPAECEGADVPQTHRFSAVIEKIERLYVGNESSEEEELADVPDDDQYDTEDSFIDDASLDEYFQVDKSTTKHKGFFVNRGKLESLNEHSLSPKPQPKKRKRKDLTIQSEKADDNHPNKHAKVGNMRMKDAARTVRLAERKSSSPSRSLAEKSEQYQDVKSFNKSNTKTVLSDSSMKPEQCMATEIHTNQLEAKDGEKQRTETTQSKDLDTKLKPSDTTHQIYQNKDSSQIDPQTRRSCNETKVLESKVRLQEKNGSSESPSRNISKVKNNGQTTRSPTLLKDGIVRPKGTALERAIRDLEDIVRESIPPNGETQNAENSPQGIKRRLPRDVKLKLAKVARLAQSSQGKISDELINQLMGIVGHIIQRKSLKRNLREMVVLGLSAKQEKDVKFQQIKKELVEMIRMRPSYLKPQVFGQQEVGSDDFQEVHRSEGVLKVKSSMDNAMEDKLCDLYDLYVEGMDEDKSSQVRKLYVQLAELWPTGTMDNHGIKRAVCRSKARKRTMHTRIKSQEKVKQQKPSSGPRVENAVCGEANVLAQPCLVREKMATDSSNQVLTSSNRITTNIAVNNKKFATSGKKFHSSTNGLHLNRSKQEKTKGIPGIIRGDTKKMTDHSLLKKKLKRKQESAVHFPTGKLELEERKHKNKLLKQESKHPNKPDFQFAGFPGL